MNNWKIPAAITLVLVVGCILGVNSCEKAKGKDATAPTVVASPVEPLTAAEELRRVQLEQILQAQLTIQNAIVARAQAQVKEEIARAGQEFLAIYGIPPAVAMREYQALQARAAKHPPPVIQPSPAATPGQAK